MKTRTGGEEGSRLPVATNRPESWKVKVLTTKCVAWFARNGIRMPHCYTGDWLAVGSSTGLSRCDLERASEMTSQSVAARKAVLDKRGSMSVCTSRSRARAHATDLVRLLLALQICRFSHQPFLPPRHPVHFRLQTEAGYRIRSDGRWLTGRVQTCKVEGRSTRSHRRRR